MPSSAAKKPHWGYDRLHERIEKRAIDEMKHAEKPISRSLFLEGKPTVSKLNAIHIGEDVPKHLKSDLAAESQALHAHGEKVI